MRAVLVHQGLIRPKRIGLVEMLNAQNAAGRVIIWIVIKMDGYTKHITYRFEAAGEIWEITGASTEGNWLDISETSKNCPLDCHCAFTVFLHDGKWHIDGDSVMQLADYWGDSTRVAIEKYLNEHPFDVSAFK